MRLSSGPDADDTSERTKDPKKMRAEAQQPQQQPSPPPTPEPDREDNGGNSADSALDAPEKEPASRLEARANEELKLKAAIDPLLWFGVLVPRELRSAQRSFVTAMDCPVENAVNSARSLRELETEIRRTRKAARRAERDAG